VDGMPNLKNCVEKIGTRINCGKKPVPLMSLLILVKASLKARLPSLTMRN
jgi:hypothetical protein